MAFRTTHKYTQLPQKPIISSPKKISLQNLSNQPNLKIYVVRISNMLNSIYVHICFSALRIAHCK